LDFTIPEELNMLQSTVRRFVRDRLIPLEPQILAREQAAREGEPLLPEDTAEDLRQLIMRMGLWAMNVPEELGGGGLDTLGSCLVVEEIAKSFTPCELGEVNPILFECNPVQKERYLLPMVEGETRPCFAMQEPHAGLDVDAFKTTATRDGDDYLLNGHKLANLPWADFDFALVFAVTNRAGSRRAGITCFLIDRGSPGFTVHPNGSREQVELMFTDCRVPATDILGEVGQGLHLGRRWFAGWQMMAAARRLGAADRILEMSTFRAAQWEALGRPSVERKALREMLAEMSIDIHAARLMIYHGAWKADEEMANPYDVVMIRLFTTEMVARALSRAVRIHSGPGGAGELAGIRALYRNVISSKPMQEALAKQKALLAARLLELDGWGVYQV
jgi:acyl-CoA dehydrogenase